MKRWIKIAIPILILGLSVVGAIAMFAVRPQPQFNAPEVPSLLVQVAAIESQPITFEVRSQGTVSPRTQTTLVAEASGQIIEVSPSFVSGGFFSKGDVLIRIDPRNYASAVKRASAEVAKAATQLQTETALAGYASEDFERLRRLNPDQGPATELALRKPQLRQAMAELQSAEAGLEKAEGDLDRTVIRAPYDGLVREKLADVGQYVNSGSQLGVTFAVDIAEVRLPVTQHDLQFLDIGKLRLNSPIEVELTAELGDTNFNWRGEVRRSEGVFDTSNRVLYLVAQIEDPYDLDGDGQAPLLMGTFVSARVVGRYAGELMLVPRHSLQRGSTLWMLDEEQRIYPREVEVVRRDKDFVYIASGVEAGELYCVTPIDQPLPGMKVRLGS